MRIRKRIGEKTLEEEMIELLLLPFVLMIQLIVAIFAIMIGMISIMIGLVATFWPIILPVALIGMALTLFTKDD